MLFIGLDLGTSGARAIAMANDGSVAGEAAFLMSDYGTDHRDPKVWQAVTEAALKAVLSRVDPDRVVAICVDGTSGTMLPVKADGGPLAAGRMYNDPCTDQGILDQIARHAPLECAAHGVTSGLAKALMFQDEFAPDKVLHQADWIGGNLCGLYVSDDNNALKTGYDPVAGCWPKWIEKTGMNMALLPKVVEPGTPIADILPSVAVSLGLPKSVQIISGTTDGCASFLATGAENIGDGVSILGTTLTLKILSDRPVFDPASGVYSHRIMGKWLVGGSSNTGGGVLLHYFTQAEMAELSSRIDPETDSGLDYYPLLAAGERFPVADPDLAPRMMPVPKDRATFLKGIFEGIAAIEASAYVRLEELGAPKIATLRSIGGGAQNRVWTRIRQRHLRLDMVESLHGQAAYGAACLARFGMKSQHYRP